MWVVFTDHIPDHAGRFFVGFIPLEPQFIHGKQYTAMHRLQAIAHIRQVAADDNTHGIIEIRLLEFGFNIDGDNFFGDFNHEPASS